MVSLSNYKAILNNMIIENTLFPMPSQISLETAVLLMPGYVIKNTYRKKNSKIFKNLTSLKSNFN